MGGPFRQNITSFMLICRPCPPPLPSRCPRASPPHSPPLVSAAGAHAERRFVGFFAAQLRNAHTRAAYARATTRFLDWCAGVGAPGLGAIEAVHVAAWVELRTCEASAPTVKQELAALRRLFDWLVIGQVLPANPATAVRGPAHSVSVGKTPGALGRAGPPPDALPPRHDPGGPSRPRAHCHDALHLRPDQRGAGSGRSRCVSRAPPPAPSPAREGRQGAPHALPPYPRGLAYGLHDRGRSR